MVTVDAHWIDEYVNQNKPIKVGDTVKKLLPNLCEPCYITKIHWDKPFYPIKSDRSRPVYYIRIQDFSGEEYDGEELRIGLDLYSVGQFDYYPNEEDSYQVE